MSIHPSRNRYDRDGTASKFFADAKLLAAIYSSAFERDGGLSLTAMAATAVQDHLGLLIV